MSKTPKPATIEVKLIPSEESKAGRMYANFVQVGLSPYDLTMRFCDAPPASNIKGNKKEVEIPTQCEIVIPIEVAGRLANLLGSSYEQYNETYNQKQNPADTIVLTEN